MNVLVAQRDAAYLSRLVEQFQGEGILVTAACSGAAVRAAVAQTEFDALVIGYIFEDMNAVQLCRSLRRSGVGTPIVVLSVLVETDDKVAVLEAGADDFLAKPADFRELVAHLRAMVRRCRADGNSVLHYAGLELDLANHNVRRGDRPIVLTQREFALLEFLLRNRERVVSRIAIGDRVWGDDYRDEGSNVVDVYVSRLRRKIDRTFDKPLIHTAPGVGYILSEQMPVR